ncbi:MAG: glycosyltransferase [Geminicoccaceae bacterium]|nr:glycosyltransferase [Geminicoccaceae bacterium]
MSERSGSPEADRPGALLIAARLPADSVSRRTVEYCRTLVAAGWRPLVAASDGPLAPELARAGGRRVELALDTDGPWARWWTGRRLARLLRAERIRLVHLQRTAGAALARRVAEQAGLPWLATIHDPAWLAGHGPGEAALLAAPRMIAVSEWVAETLAQAHGIAAERIRVIPPAVDLAEHDPERVRGPRVAAVAERWGLDLGRRILVVPGPLLRAHGHLLLIEAIAKVASEELVAVLIGAEDAEPAYVREIERAIRAAGLGQKVRFGAPPEDEPAALQLADVVVLPAIEPLPSARVIAAAQAMGRPVIVSGMGALPECVQPASTGWIVPAGDAGELAWAIGRAIALDEEVRARLAVRARAFAAESFALPRVGRRLVDLYEELVHTGRR